MNQTRSEPRGSVPGPREGPRVLVLQWHVTERCNFRCEHCYQEQYSGKDELDFDGLLGVVDQFVEFVAHCKEKEAPRPVRAHINVAGGEPFVRRDFLDLLEVFARHKDHFSYGILSNGSLIDAELARRLRELAPSFVQVSVEGAADTNDTIRARGAFERAVAALKQLRSERVPTMISFTAHRGNYHEFPDVARLGREVGAARVWADRLIPSGSGLELGDLMLTPEETREFFEIMESSRAEGGHGFCPTEIAMGRALQFRVGGGTPYRCVAGEDLVTVQPNGDVYPCRRLPILVGNLTQTRLIDLYYESRLFQELRGHTESEGCGDCSFSKQCRGGLRCLSSAVTGDPFRSDPGCWHASGTVQPGAKAMAS